MTCNLTLPLISQKILKEILKIVSFLSLNFSKSSSIHKMYVEFFSHQHYLLLQRRCGKKYKTAAEEDEAICRLYKNETFILQNNEKYERGESKCKLGIDCDGDTVSNCT